MAMNKKQLECMYKLVQDLRIAKALRFTTEVKPDVSVPTMFDKLSKGYLYNAFLDRPRAEKACSNAVNHSFGRDDKTTTQGARDLYSTKLLALKALRYEMELKCAKLLADIDEQIEKELEEAKCLKALEKINKADPYKED